MLPVQMRKRYDGLPVLQKILTTASGTIPAMNAQPLHLISRKAERRILFQAAASQKQRCERFCKRFVSELVELVPMSLLQLFFLIPLGRSLRNFFVAHKSNRHFSTSTRIHC